MTSQIHTGVISSTFLTCLFDKSSMQSCPKQTLDRERVYVRQGFMGTWAYTWVWETLRNLLLSVIILRQTALGFFLLNSGLLE